MKVNSKALILILISIFLILAPQITEAKRKAPGGMGGMGGGGRKY